MSVTSYVQNYDRELVISNAQVLGLVADTAGTTEKDLGSANFGKGKPIYLVVLVTTLVGTLAIKICSKTSAGVAVTDNLLVGPAVASGATGRYLFTLPQNVNRYVNVFYTAGTSGVVTAYLTADPS